MIKEQQYTKPIISSFGTSPVRLRVLSLAPSGLRASSPLWHTSKLTLSSAPATQRIFQIGGKGVVLGVCQQELRLAVIDYWFMVLRNNLLMQVVALPLPYRPLFPGFYMPIYYPLNLAKLGVTALPHSKLDALASMYRLCRFSLPPPPLLHGLFMCCHFVSGPDFQSQVSFLISNHKWSQLKSLTESSNPTDILHQLFLFKNFNSDLILSYFKWSQHAFQVTHSIENYVKLFILLANVRKYPKIRSLLDIFVKQGEPISVSMFCHTLLTLSDNSCACNVVFDMLILVCVNNGKLELALECFRRAGDYGFKLSVVSCNSLLSALVREGRIGNVEFVYKEMIRRRVEFNLITFNTVINGLCKAGRLNKAGDIVEDMKGYGIVPSVVTYNALIDGYCKRGGPGRMYKADALLKEMVESGVFPNVITYNVLIDGFCKDVNVAASIRLFNEMKEQGLRAGVITYNSLINGLCSDGKVDEALGLRDEMLEIGLEPNIVTYNAFINGFSKKKRLKEARELFDDIVDKGVAVNVVTFNTLINAYCKTGQLEEALVLRNLMLEKMVSPNVSTYNCLIGGYYHVGEIEAANKILDELEEKGLKADVVTYNIRINAMCGRGETRKAVRYLDEMCRKGLSPSHITYNALVDGYCQQGNPSAALTVKKRMEKEGKRPNVVTYNILIKGFCRSGKLEEANNF
ncbi:UNVERIFIED_CONTAM: Pentatricopeptide repeat-containing protein [Sesamum radiatum]|uniref:Pentatricopeptide repeat-containing protein n=1 Tax=Sesamum radiatum TaxID=300843 RepID=A0AAW2S5I0_SESRA